MVVKGQTYGNEIGKATIVDPDYKGFKGIRGMLVSYIDNPDTVGFVAHQDIMPVLSLPPQIKDKLNNVKAKKIIRNVPLGNPVRGFEPDPALPTQQLRVDPIDIAGLQRINEIITRAQRLR